MPDSTTLNVSTTLQRSTQRAWKVKVAITTVMLGTERSFLSIKAGRLWKQVSKKPSKSHVGAHSVMKGII